MRGNLILLASCAIIGASTVPAPAFAASPPASTEATIADLKAQLEDLRAREQAANARVESLEKRLDTLQAASGISSSTAAVPDSTQAMMRGRGLAPTAGQPTQSNAAAEPDRKAPAPTQSVEAVAQAQQNYYGGRFSIDPGFSYTHFTNAKLNLSGFLALDSIFLGLISIDQTDADVLTGDITARYGLTNRLQIDANLPYLYRRSTFRSGGAGGNASKLAEASVKTSGIGDASLGASYRLLTETSGRPDVVLNARVKAPTGKSPFGIELAEVGDTQSNLKVPTRLSTGTGVWGAAGGVSVLKTIDPLVVFGSLTYFHNFGRHFGDLSEQDGDQPGRASVGDAIQYGAGVAFALNDRSSLAMSFTDRLVRSTKIRFDGGSGWQRIIGSDANIGILTLGGTFALSDRASLLVNLSHGITADAPDMTLSVRLPYRF